MTDLFFPKPKDKQKKKRTEPFKADSNSKCMAYLIAHGQEHCGLPIDPCHILKRQKNAPWRDIQENIILLDRKCHDRFDGRDNSHGHSTYIEFRVWVLKYAVKRYPYLKLAYKYIKGDLNAIEYENKLKEIYSQRIGEVK